MEADPVAQRHLARLSKYRGEYDQDSSHATPSTWFDVMS